MLEVVQLLDHPLLGKLDQAQIIQSRSSGSLAYQWEINIDSEYLGLFAWTWQKGLSVNITNTFEGKSITAIRI